MASELLADHQVPTIAISGDMLLLGREHKEWDDMAEKVRVACELHGWFFVACEDISLEVQEKMFEVTKEMFNFPEEKKEMYNNALQLRGMYLKSNAFIPLCESIGINSPEELRTLEEVLWPGKGHPAFRKVFDSVHASVKQLCFLLLKMISDSYGLQEYYEKKAFDENITCSFRAIKYRLPKSDEESIGFQPHVDKNLFAVLIQNSVQGLQGLTRDGNWVFPTIPKGALAIVVGDAFQVLSNGRIRALEHKVVMSGSEERFSCGFHFIPEVILEVPPQLSDGQHPPLYRPFCYSEYREKCLKNPSPDALDNFAGFN